MEAPRRQTARSLLLALALPLLTAQERDVVERAGKHFRVVLHRGDLTVELAEQLAERAGTELERLWIVLEEMLGTKRADVRTVHIYRSVQEYLAVETATTPFAFSTNRAASEAVSPFLDANGFVGKDRDGHLRLVPDFPPSLFGELGLPHTTIVPMFRVAAELMIEPLVAKTGDHGFLRWVLVMGALQAATNPSREYGVDADFDHQRSTIITRRGLGHEFTLDSTLATETEWKQRWQWEVAQIDFAILAQHLAETDPKWAQKIMQRWSRSPTARGELARRKAAIQAVVGTDWHAATARFAKMVDGFDPQWSVYRDMWLPGKRSLLAGTPNVEAAVRNVRPPPPGDYSVAARIELGPGEPRALLVVLPFQEKSVFAWFHVGGVGISVLDSDTMQYRSLTEARCETRQGEPFDGRIEVQGREIRILVDGAVACSCNHAFTEPHGEVSFLVNERLVWLEDMKVAPLPADGKK